MDNKTYCEICGLEIEPPIRPFEAYLPEPYGIWSFHQGCFDAAMINQQVQCKFTETPYGKECAEANQARGDDDFLLRAEGHYS